MVENFNLTDLFNFLISSGLTNGSNVGPGSGLGPGSGGQLDNSNTPTSTIPEIFVVLNIYLTQILLHFSFIPVITLIIITVFGKENEDAKWFVFHTALLNLILCIIWEVTFIFQGSLETTTIQLVMQGVLKLAVNSTFPLAFTRFFYMYFKNFYVKIFNTKTLLPWLLVYDGILAGLYCGEIFTNMTIAGFIINFIILLGTIVCTAFIFLKLRKMMKMAQGTTLGTLKDLRKAAFICIFQATGISILIAITLYVHIYSSVYMKDSNGINDLGMPGGSGGGLIGGNGPSGGGSGPPGGGSGPPGGGSGPPGGGNFGPPGGGSGPPGGGNFGPPGSGNGPPGSGNGPPGSGNGPPGGGSGPSGSGPGGGLSSGPPGSGSSNSGSDSQFAFYAWMILKDWTNIFYQFFVIIDTIVTLFLLRTYRSAFKIVGMKVWNIVKKFLPVERYGGRRPTLTNINRPSINQWMNSG